MSRETRSRQRDYLPLILDAPVYDVADETPLERAPGLSARIGNELLLKREDLQPVFSFKLRGAYNKMRRLPPEALARGVDRRLRRQPRAGRRPRRAAARRSGHDRDADDDAARSRSTRSRRAARRSCSHGDTYDEAFAHALALADERGLVFVHPYDDPEVIAGQGTIGVEILRQCHGPIDADLRPGRRRRARSRGSPPTSSGCARTCASSASSRRTPTRCTRSLAAGRRVTLPHVGLFADGVAVRQVGEETFRLARQYVDEVVLVGTDELCAAIKDVFDDTRSIVEPAGALGVAGAKLYAEREGVAGQTFVAILSGANMNFDRLRFVSERAELGEQREAIFAATIPERPGSFKAFCRLIGKRQITEFNYRYAGPGEAHVFVGIEVRDRGELTGLLASLERHGVRTLDLTDDEMAKLHVRHLVGGRAGGLEDERLYRFEFPERPGALVRFLESMGAGWNISLFHYRNHGADYGRVLAGIQVPPGDERAFGAFLRGLGYAYADETANPAYALFLR